MNLIIKATGEKECRPLLNTLHLMGYKWRDGTPIYGNDCGIAYKKFKIYVFVNKDKKVISYRQQYGNDLICLDYKNIKNNILAAIENHIPEDNKNVIISLNTNYITEQQ